ncbi:glycosyltransferase family 2 protein [Clostridium swellfunianum]|uniref:glycosyltransferase family 2 protein n=1 Tax=Clostridium swellfunianum TaxID=1367462 RepID=UPI00202E0D28|nr:glycosyltransferase family 2 protein [Clostridium swellfunianum]MCM0647444.1 glycosyltransferase family 2 protein [Clostridium swellfunianum]
MSEKRDVTVIMPVFNEEKHISNSIECIINQEWENCIEILVVDGESTDNTVNIIKEMSKKLPQNRTIKIYSNPKRYIPVSLNIACENASNNIIVRVDGHTYAPSDYVKESVRALESIDFNGTTGGRCIIKASGKTKMAIAISIGVSNKFGVGNALYRTINEDKKTLLEVDTVPFGAFTKELWTEIGGYDEALLYDEDYDYNYRIKKSGKKVILNTKIVLDYFSRKDIKSLWGQYFRYGYWANRFCLKHKVIPSVRRLIPMSFVMSLLAWLIIYLPAFYALLAIYLVTMLIISLYEGAFKRKDLALGINLMLVFLTLHFSYGIGGWISLFYKGLRK